MTYLSSEMTVTFLPKMCSDRYRLVRLRNIDKSCRSNEEGDGNGDGKEGVKRNEPNK